MKNKSRFLIFVLCNFLSNTYANNDCPQAITLQNLYQSDIQYTFIQPDQIIFETFPKKFGTTKFWDMRIIVAGPTTNATRAFEKARNVMKNTTYYFSEDDYGKMVCVYRTSDSLVNLQVVERLQ